jgi:hypothetical protein
MAHALVRHAIGERRSAHARPNPNRAKVILMSAASPMSAPPATTRPSSGCPVGGSAGQPPAMTSPSRPAAAASTSRCAAAISCQISSGLTVQSRCARSRPAGSDRSSLSAVYATAPNATAFASLSQNTIRAADAPPSQAARYCSAVAAGP